LGSEQREQGAMSDDLYFRFSRPDGSWGFINSETGRVVLTVTEAGSGQIIDCDDDWRESVLRTVPRPRTPPSSAKAAWSSCSTADT
jgi:hypothetical protein